MAEIYICDKLFTFYLFVESPPEKVTFVDIEATIMKVKEQIYHPIIPPTLPTLSHSTGHVGNGA